jgi:hypothetical protein
MVSMRCLLHCENGVGPVSTFASAHCLCTSAHRFEVAATSDISTHYTNDLACATLNYVRALLCICGMR